jgi:hypothetical protein
MWARKDVYDGETGILRHLKRVGDGSLAGAGLSGKHANR